MTFYSVFADLFIPLAILFIAYTVYKTIKHNAKGQGVKQGVFFILLLTLVYVVRLIDNYFSIWPLFSLDYSTHSAFFLAILFFFWFDTIRIKILMLFLFVFYAMLMVVQKYHTISDVLTTVGVLLPFMGIVTYIMKKLGLKKY